MLCRALRMTSFMGKGECCKTAWNFDTQEASKLQAGKGFFDCSPGKSNSFFKLHVCWAVSGEFTLLMTRERSCQAEWRMQAPGFKARSPAGA